jgi:NAD(P)H-hydrate epimerase
VPSVSAPEMRQLDRLAVDTFGIELVQMMELAGAAVAEVARQEFGPLAARRVIVLVGPGNNGAGGLVAARHLVNRGASVEVVLGLPVRQLPAIARERLATLIAMGVPCSVAGWDIGEHELARTLVERDIVVDALLGYGARGAPGGSIEMLVRAAATVRRSVDPDSGAARDPAVTATATVTLALPKRGLLAPSARPHVGRLYLADIGLPGALYRRAGLGVETPFGDGPIVLLD